MEIYAIQSRNSFRQLFKYTSKIQKLIILVLCMPFLLWDGSTLLFHLILIKWPYLFLSILSLVLLDLILSEGFILFLKNIFHLIGIWSCGYYYKVQGWTHGKYMPDTCLPHVVHMYYCALLCNAVCTVFSIVLLIHFFFHFTYLAFHLTYQSCIPLTNLRHSCLLLIVIAFTHCMCIFDS